MSDTIHGALKRDNDCPDLDQLFQALEQDQNDARRVEAENHLKQCPGCQTEWALFRQFEAGEVRPDERAHVEHIVKQLQTRRIAERRAEKGEVPTFWQRFLTPAWMGGAAVAMAALLLTIGLTSQWRNRQSSTIEYGDDHTLRSKSVEITTPLRDLAQVPQEINWMPVNGATSYSAALTEVDGTRIFYTKVTSPSLPVPEQVRKMLAQGKIVFMVVTAFAAPDFEIAHSGVQRIQVSQDRNSPR